MIYNTGNSFEARLGVGEMGELDKRIEELILILLQLVDTHGRQDSLPRAIRMKMEGRSEGRRAMKVQK